MFFISVAAFDEIQHTECRIKLKDNVYSKFWLMILAHRPTDSKTNRSFKN